MGYLTKTSGNKTSQALAGIGQAITSIGNIPSQMVEAKQKAEEFKIKQQQAQLQLEQQQEMQRLMYGKKLNDMISDGFETSDPKSWMALHQKDLQTALEKSGSQSSMGDIQNLLMTKDESLAAALKDIRSASGFIMTATPQTQSQELFKTQANKALNAFDTVIGKMPSGLRDDYRKGKQDFISQAQKLRDQYIDWDQSKLAADTAKTNAAAKPVPQSAEDKRLGQLAADDYVKAVKALPEIKERRSKLTDMNKLIDKVWTGPLAGKTLPFFLQKLGSDDAQRMQYFLSNEGVKMIMDYAQKAGVRAADTEPERQFILSAIANPNMSKAVLQEVIARTQKVLDLATQRTNEMQKWKASGKAISDWYAQADAPLTVKEPAQLSAEDQAALDWANANPKDPRAAQIKQQLGM